MFHVIGDIMVAIWLFGFVVGFIVKGRFDRWLRHRRAAYLTAD